MEPKAHVFVQAADKKHSIIYKPEHPESAPMSSIYVMRTWLTAQNLGINGPLKLKVTIEKGD